MGSRRYRSKRASRHSCTPDLSCLPWADALSPRPQYLLLVTVNVSLTLGPLQWSPPGPPPPAVCYISKLPSVPLRGRPRGPSSGTPPAPERCYKVSCDDIARHPVFRGRQCRVCKGQYLLFNWQVGDPSLW